ncbi:MAG: hypothetical protein M0R47_16950 [Methylobacter sp.]|nr:hypothetical protein [Methylobacter sp.]MCK9622212.1 hypothetical protein [Methylobacter sp.]
MNKGKRKRKVRAAILESLAKAAEYHDRRRLLKKRRQQQYQALRAND